ncbi:hypothetical protein BASA81_000975 [Batrachochytrium salamandrivorans]|nr:hypothetical protein BASA81_000975 [Batrachochytrium salamandrivorans]
MQELVDRLVYLHRASIVSGTAVADAAVLLHLGQFSAITTDPPEQLSLLSQTKFIPEVVSILCSPSSSQVLISETFKLLEEFTSLDETFTLEERKLALDLVNKMLDCDVPQVCVSSKQFVESLEFLSNLCEIYPSAAPEHLAERTDLLTVSGKLLAGSSVGWEEKLACSELLCVVLQNSSRARKQCDITIVLLPALQFQSEDSKVEEEEVLENLVSAMGSVLFNSHERKIQFGQAGLERALALIRQNTMLTQRLGFKLVSLLLKNCEENCRRFVDLGGLKVVFVFQVAKTLEAGPTKRSKHSMDPETKSAALSTLYSLCVNLKAVYHQRLMTKLREPGKMDRLVELHDEFCAKVAARPQQEEGEEEDGWDSETEYLELCEHGLAELEYVDVVLASAKLEHNDRSDDITAQITKVVAELADRELVLDEFGVVEEARTFELKSTLLGMV